MYYECCSFSHLCFVREFFNLTQTQLGQILDVSKNTVSSWECGSWPSLKHYLDLCEFFNLPFTFFIDSKDKLVPFNSVFLALFYYYGSSFSGRGDPHYFDSHSVSHFSMNFVPELSDPAFLEMFKSMFPDALVFDALKNIFDRLDFFVSEYTPPVYFARRFYKYCRGIL